MFALTRSAFVGRLFFLATMILLATMQATAQVDAALTDVSLIKDDTTGEYLVTIRFDKSFTAAEARSSKYLITDYGVDPPQTFSLVPDTVGNFSIDLKPATGAPPLQIGHRYHLEILGFMFKGKMPKNRLQAAVKERKAGSPELQAETADGKEDSNVYVAGEIATARGSKGFGSVEIKVSYPFLKNLNGTTNEFSPFFDLNASTNPKADPDTMNFGLRWVRPLSPLNRLQGAGGDRRGSERSNFGRTFVENTFKAEATHDFENANAIWSPRLIRPIPAIGGENAYIYFEPFLGFELGGNIVSPVAEAENKFIARGLFGSTMLVALALGADQPIQKVSFEAAYTRRLLFRDEVSFRVDDAGKFFPLNFGTNPRDFVSTKLNFTLSKFLGTYIGYDWGEVPPSYKLVNHRLKVGLNFRQKYK
jgi:hypothetical protein